LHKLVRLHALLLRQIRVLTEGCALAAQENGVLMHRADLEPDRTHRLIQRESGEEIHADVFFSRRGAPYPFCIRQHVLPFLQARL